MEENPNYTFLRKHMPDTRYLLLQGGTRSGKTYATLQTIIRLCYDLKNAGFTVSICRKTMPALKATAMRDFFELLQSVGAYDEACHNKTEQSYLLWGNLIEFLNLDDEQKVRGRKRHLLYVNEANEASAETVRQLLFRTSGPCIFDYNPSISEEHWLLSDLLRRKNAKRIITTYRDNPHLSASQVGEIESLQAIDPELWKVFGLGEVGQGMRGLVFRSFDYGWEEGARLISFGLDFGFDPDPVALVEVREAGDALYLRQHIYRQRMTPDDIRESVKAIVPRGVEVFCDHRTDLIEMLFRAGVNAKPAKKTEIDTGVKLMQGKRLIVHPDSHDLARELKYYKYKEDKDGNSVGGAFAKSPDHAIDAARYGYASAVLTAKAPPVFESLNI